MSNRSNPNANPGFPTASNTEFIDFHQAIKPFTMVDAPRLIALYDAVRYVVRAGIPGDLIECGVYKGGCCMLMALTLLSLGDTQRRIYLYDTYSGMAEPGKYDLSFDGAKKAREIWAQEQEADHNRWCYASVEEVRHNLASTGFNPDRLVFAIGRTEDTIPHIAPDRIAVLRLDTDLYNSTKHELEHLFPRLSTNGVLLSDDYSHWAGHRKAVDDYLAGLPAPMLLTRVSCGAVGLKTALHSPSQEPT